MVAARTLLPEALEWKPILPEAELAVLSGDPECVGAPFVIRFRTSNEIQVPPHGHPEDEHVTVLQGPFGLGLGEKYDATALGTLPAGSYTLVPKGVRHFASYGAGTIVQVNGIGPFQSIYVDAAP